ncbi:MAG: hypothetical protein KAJ09_07865 [Deltaproteobacteria bacterium]|nr:hypothetical protein [Deltaproteobacteria bacterium]
MPYPVIQNGLGAQQKATWKRPAQDLKCLPGWPCPQTLAEIAEAEARKEGGEIRNEAIAEQLWRKAFEPKAKTPTEAIQQMRLFYDAVEKYGDYDLKLNWSLQPSLYSPHANLPYHYGASWSLIKEKGILHSKSYGYIHKFFPEITVAPHGYQIFASLLGDLIFDSPRMKASAVAARAKKVQEYQELGAANLGPWTTYNNAIISWAKDFSVAESTFDKRVDRLIQMVEAWKGVPWGHNFFESFLPSPSLTLPSFIGGMNYNDPDIVLTQYFPTTQEKIQGDIAYYLTTVQKEWEAHFEILLNEKIEKLKKEMEAHEDVAKVLKWTFLLLSVLAMIAGAPVLFKIIVVKIPKAVFSVMALRNMQKDELEGTKDIFGLISLSADSLDTLRLWIGSKAPLPPELPPAPDGEGRYALFIGDVFIGRADDTEELVNYAVAAGKVGDKVELGDEETNSPIGIGLITKEGIEWVPESVAGNFQNLDNDETRSLADSLVGDDGFPWWLVGVPIAVLVASS